MFDEIEEFCHSTKIFRFEVKSDDAKDLIEKPKETSSRLP